MVFHWGFDWFIYPSEKLGRAPMYFNNQYCLINFMTSTQVDYLKKISFMVFYYSHNYRERNIIVYNIDSYLYYNLVVRCPTIY